MIMQGESSDIIVMPIATKDVEDSVPLSSNDIHGLFRTSISCTYSFTLLVIYYLGNMPLIKVKSGTTENISGYALFSATDIHVGWFNPFFPTVPTFAVRETASLGIMGEPRVPP